MSADSSSRPEGRRAAVAGAFRAFVRRPREERRAAVRLLPALVRIEAGLRSRPLPRLAGRLGIRVGTETTRLPRVEAVPLSDRERLDVEAARRLVRRWPAEAKCLRRALLVGHALRDRGPVLRIGVARHDGAVHAHAWIEVNGVVPDDTERGVTFLPLRGASGR